MEVRPIRPEELEPAGALLHAAFERVATRHGHPTPWSGEREAIALLARYREAAPAHTVVAETGGAVVGVGALRVRGEVATLGPIAVAADGRGIGGALMDALVERGEEAGAVAHRVYVDGWNPRAFALYAGRGFNPVDVVAHIERPADGAPGLDGSRGLEVREVAAEDFEELALFDHKLTGNERGTDLAASVRLVARRRGALVGYLGGAGPLLGPAVAVDVADLGILLATALAAEPGRAVRARLSTAVQTATLAAFGLGFRVREVGAVLSRGAPPPTRPAQLYSLDPEVL